MKYRSELLPGNVYTSSAGNLPCKRVVHAVGPKWRGGMQGEPNELFEAVSRSLDATNQAGLQSIAIPVISSGIYGYPVVEATKVICEAVVDYLDKNPQSSVQEVHLMDSTPARCQSFIKSMKNWLQQSQQSATQNTG